ncbi:MAG: YbaK/EbsC family protein [Pseudomonadales bacterium]|nr:YbaK/EbsC family protein [Pseudomonadales bacterium]
MSISNTLQSFLNNKHINYQLVKHPYSETSFDSAVSANVPAKRVTKAVILKDDDGYLMAVVPADKDANIESINKKLGRMLMLADEKELDILFSDCAHGAIPAIGEAFNLKVIWDDMIAKEPDCYIEAGDHVDLVYLSHQDFMTLMQNQAHGAICH